MATTDQTETAIFAGGCFWCMEPVFDKLDGVISVVPGYTGGKTRDPSYEEVCGGGTGHVEAVRIIFYPSKISFRDLLDVFWHNIDPTVKNRQFCDFGAQYQSVVFYTNDQQRKVAEESRKELEEESLGAHVETQILPAAEFFPAEEYHRQFYLKNPLRYQLYHQGCGRDSRLKEIWRKDN